MAEEAAAAAEAAAEAAAAQEAAELQDLVLCLDICGVSQATLVAGITEKEGYRSLRQFSRVKHGEIAEMAKNLRTRKIPQPLQTIVSVVFILMRISFQKRVSEPCWRGHTIGLSVRVV